MSAFEGTWLDIALRDCGINSFIVVGVATEVGIEPTVRHGVDLGYILIVVTDACGAGNNEAAARSLEGLKFSGDAILTDAEVICATLRRLVHGNPSSHHIWIDFLTSPSFPVTVRWSLAQRRGLILASDNKEFAVLTRRPEVEDFANRSCK
jgi:hypothetical protein